MNYLDLINIKYSFKKGLFILVLTLFLLIIYILNLSMYESISTYGYFEEDKIVTKLSIDNPDIINTLKYIKIGSKDYKAEIVDISDVMLDNESFVNYQIVKLKINDRFNNNEAFKFDIFYNEEKVYKKLKKIIF